MHKLISVLESIEKLPVYIYDPPGSGYGLQVREPPNHRTRMLLIVYRNDISAPVTDADEKVAFSPSESSQRYVSGRSDRTQSEDGAAEYGRATREVLVEDGRQTMVR